MPAAASAKPVFDLKSTAWTLTALRLQSADLATLVAALDQRFADSPGLFDDDAVVLDFSALCESDAVPDLAALLPHLRRHGLLPIAAQGGSSAQMAAARAAGLAEATDAAPSSSTSPPAPLPAAPPATLSAASAPARPAPAAGAAALPPARDRVVRDPLPRPPKPEAPKPNQPAPALEPQPPAPGETQAAALATLVVDKPLRSGQRVYARGADLVVLAMVSFGAEVIADGNIHVYGPLRGRAIAGARGYTGARIFSTCMEPQLVSIAGIYRTTETPLPAAVLGQAAQVRLDGEKIIVEPLSS